MRTPARASNPSEAQLPTWAPFAEQNGQVGHPWAARPIHFVNGINHMVKIDEFLENGQENLLQAAARSVVTPRIVGASRRFGSKAENRL